MTTIQGPDGVCDVINLYHFSIYKLAGRSNRPVLWYDSRLDQNGSVSYETSKPSKKVLLNYI